MSLTPVDEVLADLEDRARCLVDVQTCPLTAATGRVLAESIVSSINVPPLANSAMDGYAGCASDLKAGESYRVSARIAAGQIGAALEPGTLVRIFTGAPLPPGADTVVIQENTEILDNDRVVLQAPAIAGDNVRNAGQDIRQGAEVLPKGHQLRPQDLGLLAATGQDRVQVYNKLKVAILATGDELVDPPNPLGPGQIYNSNHFSVKALLTRFGFEVIDLGRVADDRQVTIAALMAARDQADVVISTGGVSVGEEDHVKAAVESMGTLDIWRLAIKPGKPLAFGYLAEHSQAKPFFGLPGNPVSAYVTLLMIAYPFLARCQGMSNPTKREIYGRATFSIQGGNRREYLRVQIEPAEGENRLQRFPNQGSGVLTSVSWADGLAEIDIGQTVREGDPLKVYLLPDG